MGMKKWVLRRVLGTAAEALMRGNGVGRVVKNANKIKKIVIAAVFLGLVFLVGTVALLGYIISSVSNMVTATPDADLVALERLLTEKTIVLTEEQKTSLLPVIEALANPEQLPEQATALKEKVWDILEPAQVQAVQDWQDKTTKEAGTLIETGISSLADTVSKYTGISEVGVQNAISAVSGWWQLNGPEKGSAGGLQKAVEGN